MDVDYDGWDTHEWQAYRFPDLVKGLSQALVAFYTDLSEYHSRLQIVVMSEFGRRLKANESGKTDHGHGGVMMVLGGQIKGEKTLQLATVFPEFAYVPLGIYTT
jgi:uncharacterized protein (DUF1501 family)